ncbi:MAG: Bax inhibitor-1/YccA family protein [Holosporaceae bacterium]|jgi:FtsH-binding integral membrane protein|nr:Bax inhibitor-1/YccA family protein [Holosporaceae bacterium]
MKDKVTSFYKEAAGVLDAGLRKYMLNVFSYMSVGLALTAIVAYSLSNSVTFMLALFSSPVVSWILALVPFGISIYLSVRIASMSAERAKWLFIAFAVCLGISLSSIFMVYSSASIAYTFFVTSSMFLAMVIYGYVTEKDLTGAGSFLIMGLMGVIIASIVNIFLRSSVTELVLSIIGVIIFTGLTAYDTQRIKSYYFDSDSAEASEKKAIFGALQLYLDFINLFLYALRFLGVRRD